MKVSVVISVCDNRKDMFKRSLDTWSKQTMDKKDFELVVVDDAERSDLKKLCKTYSKEHRLQIQYLNIDNSKADVPVTTFLPIVSNNVGMRIAKGDVVVITGPETLQAEDNLKIAHTMVARKECAYGLVYRSNIQFVDYIDSKWDELKDKPFENLFNIAGAKADCRTRPPHPPSYWYLMAVKKEYVEKIGGVDEAFAKGFCAEDDDFSNRMERSGVMPVFEHKMIGIHQDHSREDRLDAKHSIRKTPEGQRLRRKNTMLWKSNTVKGVVEVNKDHTWGDTKVIVKHETW